MEDLYLSYCRHDLNSNFIIDALSKVNFSTPWDKCYGLTPAPSNGLIKSPSHGRYTKGLFLFFHTYGSYLWGIDYTIKNLMKLPKKLRNKSYMNLVILTI